MTTEAKDAQEEQKKLDRKYQKRYRERLGKKEYNRRGREWRKKNPKKCKEYSKRFMERYHKDEEFRKRVIEYTRKYKVRHPFRVWANRAIQNHRKRKIPCNFSRKELEEWARQTKICYICGTILEYGCRKDRKQVWNPKSASLDRINNDKPLTLSNAQIICRQCNVAKSVMSMEEFMEYCERVVKRFRKERVFHGKSL